MSVTKARYSIRELAAKASVSRRTVRFYIQRGLLPVPRGRGRGQHYDDTHLAVLLRVKALQEQGWTLEAIKRELVGSSEPKEESAGPPPQHVQPQVPGEAWFRQTIMPGYELHVHAGFPALREEHLALLALTIRKLLDSEDGETR